MNCPRCETEIDEHEANRCLDGWVAEAVMEWKRQTIFIGGDETEVLMHPSIFREFDQFPHYSTSIAAAWEVVERLHEKSHHAAINLGRQGNIASFRKYGTEKMFLEHAPAIQLAICRAALKAT